MKLRENAAKIATQFGGRCTCAAMDGGQGYPLTPPPARRADAAAPRLSPTAA